VVFDIVVAADRAWGIGKDNALPWPKLRADLRHFKTLTSTASEGRRNAIVMGRKTWQSKEVGERPLPRRLNVIVSRNPLDVPEGAVAVRSLDEALALTASTTDIENTFVVGGAGLLQGALTHPALRHVYLTRIDGRFDCDVVIPDLDARGFVKTAWEGEQSGEDGGVAFRIERLARG